MSSWISLSLASDLSDFLKNYLYEDINIAPAGSFLYQRHICKQKALKIYGNCNIKIILVFYTNLVAVATYSIPIALCKLA